jgi:hypothetical protein
MPVTTERIENDLGLMCPSICIRRFVAAVSPTVIDRR